MIKIPAHSSSGAGPSIQDWLEGARLRTLPAAAAPVFVGIGAAIHLGALSVGMSLLALLVALLLQVGVNFANDYSDGIRGTDEERLGPVRLTASGIVPRKQVLLIALSCFGLSGIAGLALIIWSGSWWLLAAGVGAIAAAWFYTGGNRPYGYLGVGLSELFVFVFFGLMATVGTTWVQAHSAPAWLWIAASGMGLVSIALLMVNNIRDIPTDRKVGKTTLAVRLGDRNSRILYMSVLAAAAALAGIAVGMAGPAGWLGFWLFIVLLVLGIATALPVAFGAAGPQLLRTLRNTGFFALSYGVLVASLLATWQG